MSQLFGVVLVSIASTSSSVGMNFQKLAHRQTEYEDPRTMDVLRINKLTSSVYFRPYMIIGFVLSIAAVVCDALALMFVGTTTIGILGCMSIPINVFVSKYLLYEDIKNKAKIYIATITIGCILCLITTHPHNPMETFIRFARVDTAVFIASMWLFAGACAIVGWASDQKLLAYGILSGTMGSQFVTMGKYLIDITYLLQYNLPLPPTLQIIGVVSLFIFSLPLQIIFLNKSLEKFNATHSVAIFQCTWCVLNVVLGIVIFGDMEHAELYQILIFVSGFCMTMVGIVGLSRQIEYNPPTLSEQNLASYGF